MREVASAEGNEVKAEAEVLGYPIIGTDDDLSGFLTRPAWINAVLPMFAECLKMDLGVAEELISVD